MPTVEELKEENGGQWGEHPRYGCDDWRHEVDNNYTRLGYWEWVAARLDEGTQEVVEG